MAVERIGVGHREVERQRLAGDLDVEPDAAANRGGAILEHLDRPGGLLLVVHRHTGALEKRPAVLGRHRLQLLRRLHARGDLDHALAARPHGADQRVELRHRRDRRRHGHAAIARMIERIGGAEPDRAMGHGVGHHRLHPGQLLGRRVLALRGILAHHRGADGRMAGQHRHVGVGAAAAQHAHVFAEALEVPGDALAQRVEVHALDHREIADDEVAHRGRRRHDAEAAIADHRRGDAERRRGRERGIPGDLRVVVRVHVDDAGREHQPVGVDGLVALVADRTDGDDPAVLDRDVGALGIVAQAVDDGGAADDEIDHQSLRPFFSAP